MSRHDDAEFRTVVLTVRVHCTVPSCYDKDDLSLDVVPPGEFCLVDVSRAGWHRVDSGYPQSVKPNLEVETIDAAWEP